MFLESPVRPPMRLSCALALAVLLLVHTAASAQIPGFRFTQQFTITIEGHHYRLEGEVEMEQDDQQFFADLVDYWSDTGRVEARGNVVYVSPTSRIAAERMDFNAKTRLGIFYNASGTAQVMQQVDRSMFGTQEPDAFFYGETIEKVGLDKYRITRGGFTTCVQPEPRWELTASTVTLTLDKYAVMRNPVLKVKGVPMFYAPVLYYPINKEDRATGFLIPVYGSSTLRGQSLSNAFFWAINRSHDMTAYHDWFTSTGQGVGSDYRYISGPGSEGNARFYMLNEHAAEFRDTSGSVRSTPDRRSFQVRSSVMQTLPARLRARGNVDYFSDLTVQQTYNGNVLDASRRTRTYGGNLTGAWGANSLSATVNVNQVLYGETDSTKYGGLPRIAFNRAMRRMGPSPVYWGFGSEFATLVRSSRSGTQVQDQGLSRVDVSPSLRVPFTRWPFLTVNSSVSWRNTFYTESYDPRGVQVENTLLRQYFDMRADITGPVLTRIWDTPTNGYAEKFKHIIEPNLNVQRISAIEDYDSIVKLESLDYTVGDVTRLGYGLTQRFLAKRREGGPAATSREFLNVSIFQSYYTDARASQFDPSFNSSFSGSTPSNFSPVVLAVRGIPTNQINATLRMEYDHVEALFRTIRANATVGAGTWLSTTGGWSRRVLTETRRDNFVNADTTIRTPGGQLGGTFSFNYDISRETMLQRRIIGFYNAQCCGVAIEYQTYNFPYFDPRFPVPRDRRFNLSFTLAGVGTFSNFFGAFGGATRQ